MNLINTISIQEDTTLKNNLVTAVTTLKKLGTKLTPASYTAAQEYFAKLTAYMEDPKSATAQKEYAAALAAISRYVLTPTDYAAYIKAESDNAALLSGDVATALYDATDPADPKGIYPRLLLSVNTVIANINSLIASLNAKYAETNPQAFFQNGQISPVYFSSEMQGAVKALQQGIAVIIEEASPTDPNYEDEEGIYGVAPVIIRKKAA